MIILGLPLLLALAFKLSEPRRVKEEAFRVLNQEAEKAGQSWVFIDFDGKADWNNTKPLNMYLSQDTPLARSLNKILGPLGWEPHHHRSTQDPNQWTFYWTKSGVRLSMSTDGDKGLPVFMFMRGSALTPPFGRSINELP